MVSRPLIDFYAFLFSDVFIIQSSFSDWSFPSKNWNVGTAVIWESATRKSCVLAPQKKRERQSRRGCGRGRNPPDSSEQIAAQRARRVVAGAEPLVEAGGVEFLAARPARQLGKLVVGAVQDVIADVALFDALEALVDVALPQRQPVQNRSVLYVAKRRRIRKGIIRRRSRCFQAANS